MNKSKAYRATDVNDVLIDELGRRAAGRSASVGIDVGKYQMHAVVRWSDGQFERPWKVKSPAQIGLFVEHLRTLAERCAVTTALEPTGTYGDVLRDRLGQAGLPVLRVSGQAAHDYAEAFDGVPSQHDGKDAAVIAELAAFGKGRPWPSRPPDETTSELCYQVDWMDGQQRIRQLWMGRLEALLARHWPELTRLLDLSSVTLLEALSHYGGPAALASDAAAARRLARWGRWPAGSATIENVLASARQTIGVAQQPRDSDRVRQYAAQALAADREVRGASRRLGELASGHETLRRMGGVVGMATAGVLWAVVGDPRNYPCGAAYRKAAGLNLKERSSGRYRGQLKITKRGPALARRWLYFAAMRMVQNPAVKPWYEAKKAKDKDRGKGALIAVTRKLALALHAVGAQGATFDARRLLPGKPAIADARATVSEAEIPY